MLFLYRLLFSVVCLEKFCKIGRFFHEFVPKNPAKFDFFFRNLLEALQSGVKFLV